MTKMVCVSEEAGNFLTYFDLVGANKFSFLKMYFHFFQ